jgi:hypothetical protein
MKQAILIVGFIVSAQMGLLVHASDYPFVSLSDLPDSLRYAWRNQQAEMTSTSHCAAAYDSPTDTEKMAFRCSIHIKMSSEGERRAMKYCEEKRAQKNIKAPCRLVRY